MADIFDTLNAEKGDVFDEILAQGDIFDILLKEEEEEKPQLLNEKKELLND